MYIICGKTLKNKNCQFKFLKLAPYCFQKSYSKDIKRLKDGKDIMANISHKKIGMSIL